MNSNHYLKVQVRLSTNTGRDDGAKVSLVLADQTNTPNVKSRTEDTVPRVQLRQGKPKRKRKFNNANRRISHKSKASRQA